MRFASLWIALQFPGLAWADADGDGYDPPADCDDANDTVHPGATDTCGDGVDNDCDATIGPSIYRWYEDRDFDGYGDSNLYYDACATDLLPTFGALGRWVTAPGDCNDSDDGMNPGRVEFCDHIDNDCSGGADDNLPTVAWWTIDADHDGFGRISIVGAVSGSDCPPNNDYTSWSAINTDCDDEDATVHPLITEADWWSPVLWGEDEERGEYNRSESFIGDGIDQDCDGVDLCYFDEDGDAFGTGDNPDEHPGVGHTFSITLDNDVDCTNASTPYTASIAGDCDDADPTISPDAIDVPDDGVDQDCDGADEIVVTADTDAGEDTDNGTTKSSCGCQSTRGGSSLLAVLLPLIWRRRRQPTPQSTR